jgi:hypothetical protein
MANMLTDPKFAANPPVKLNIDAKILGLVIAILAVIGAIFTLFLGGLLTLIGFVGGVAPIWLLGTLIALAAEVLAAIGGFQMYQLNRRGKILVIYALALGLLGAVLVVIGQIMAYSGFGYLGYGAGGAIFGLIIDVIVYGIIYYLVVISRWPGDAPLTQSPGGYGAPPPPPPS